MIVLKTKVEVRAWREERAQVGLVPTMGALHAGHMALVDACREQCMSSVASIYVNPTQFDKAQDLTSYPRTIESDLAKLEERGCDAVFMPSDDEMYSSRGTSISVPDVSDGLEGAHRPGHFQGVATVVAKLFHVVSPTVAYFGMKDLQQLAVVRKMVSDLDFETEIRSVETVREADGLALSSRNALLSEEERELAPIFFSTLVFTAKEILAGNVSPSASLTQAKQMLEHEGLAVDYIVLVDPETMRPVLEPLETARIVGAVRLGSVRLLDNIALVSGASQ